MFCVTASWQDGCTIACCASHRQHACFLPKQQWVARLVPPEHRTSKPTFLAAEAIAETWHSSVLTMPLHGTSMGATIPHGAILHVSPHVAEHSQVGQVLVVVSPQRNWVAHRVIRLEQNAEGHRVLIMRGDARRREDEPVVSTKILGQVSRVFWQGQDWHPQDWTPQVASFLHNQTHLWKARFFRWYTNLLFWN